MNIIIENSVTKTIDLSFLKAHLRIEHEHEDEYLNTIIDSASEIVENNTEQSILKKKYRLTTNKSAFSTNRKIEIPIAPVLEVCSVKKITGRSTKEEVLFSIENVRDKMYVIPNKSWTQIEVEYYAGMTEKPEEIPKDIKYAILQIAKNMYECSDENILESQYVKHLIKVYKNIPTF